MNKVSELKLAPLWLNPEHTVATARHVMAGHKVRAIGILDGRQFIGIVSYENLAGHNDEVELGPIVSKVVHSVSSQSTLREVAQILSRENFEFLPIVDDGRFAGIVSATMLLRELSRTWDPLTELSWSDRLREWGMEKLERGDELTILFVDLDDFGQYNKAHGHIVGDRVLQLVANFLKDSIDPARDVLVRYGGDEFAIGTIRPRREAEALRETMLDRMEGAFVSGAERKVEVSIGMFGGRRTIERENIHFSSTLDSLINLASKDCLARKAQKKALAQDEVHVSQIPPEFRVPTPEEPSDARIAEVSVDEYSDRGVAMVTIEAGGVIWRGVSARTANVSAAESVAMATFSALERWLEPIMFKLDELEVSSSGERHSVRVRGVRIDVGSETPISAEIDAVGEKMILVGEAVLSAARSRG